MSYPQEPTPDTLALFRELLLDTLHRQLATADALDSKAWQALGVGSVVIGLAVAGDRGGWWLLFPLVGYVVLAIGALLCLRVRGWKVPPKGDELWRDAWYVEGADLDQTVVNALAQGEPVNRELLESKASALRFALVGLLVEIVALTIVAAGT
jgi:hypothetical protein